MKHQIIALSLLFLGFHSFADSDNSRNNDQERATNELTAEDQTESSSDIDITQRIRQDIIKEKSLSTYAKNVKIITQNGEVTLKGPVRSEQEKTKIMQVAHLAAGKTKVKNELSVVSDKK